MTRALLNSGQGIPLHLANRHGLITGQTGTGKTVTLMRLAEQFSRAGVPSFVADVKGDIAALARACPVELVDPYGQIGRPIRITFDGLGADLSARALELSDAQAGCLEIAFAYASRAGLPLGSIAELRICLQALGSDRRAAADLGHVSAASVAVIMRALLRLEMQGGSHLFGRPAFDVAELIADPSRVTILAAEHLLESPRLYGAFLLSILSDLWRRLPEIGDVDKPRLVLFFDESHLLFSDASPALLRRLEQTVRLIRSKGVGLYFASQSPADIPDPIRAQLAHHIAHDRALPIGSARFRTLSANGSPLPEVVARVDLPACELGALTPAERPAVAAPVSAEPGRFDVWGYAFLAFCLVALTAAGFTVYALWQAGALGMALAATIGAGLALSRGKG